MLIKKKNPRPRFPAPLGSYTKQNLFLLDASAPVIQKELTSIGSWPGLIYWDYWVSEVISQVKKLRGMRSNVLSVGTDWKRGVSVPLTFMPDWRMVGMSFWGPTLIWLSLHRLAAAACCQEVTSLRTTVKWEVLALECERTAPECYLKIDYL